MVTEGGGGEQRDESVGATVAHASGRWCVHDAFEV